MDLVLSSVVLPVRLMPNAPISDADLLRFCADNEPLRVERDANGELIVMSPTGTEGGYMEADVALELGIWARADGRGRVSGANTGVKLLDTSVRAADAAWISWERWNSVPQDQRQGYANICPEFVIEVRSKSDALNTLQTKMQMWLANGAELTWLIDPIRKVVEVYRSGEPAEIHQEPMSVQGTGPVCGFEPVMSRIWG